jgi:twitching motility protein PilT
MSTLHTISAAQTVERIIDLFPAGQQSQIRTQLAAILQCVVSQQLIPDLLGRRRLPAFEILVVNDAVRNMIREDKVHMIASAIQTGVKQGMLPMDYSIAQLLKTNQISEQEAYQRCHDPEMLTRYLSVG